MTGIKGEFGKNMRDLGGNIEDAVRQYIEDAKPFIGHVDYVVLLSAKEGIDTHLLVRTALESSDELLRFLKVAGALYYGDVKGGDRAVNTRERDAKALLRFIRERQQRGASTRDLAKKFRRLSKRYRDELLEDLTESQDIVLRLRKRGGGPAAIVAYYRSFDPGNIGLKAAAENGSNSARGDVRGR